MKRVWISAFAVGFCALVVSTGSSQTISTPDVAIAPVSASSAAQLGLKTTSPPLNQRDLGSEWADGALDSATWGTETDQKRKRKGRWCTYTDGSEACYCTNPNKNGRWVCFWGQPRGKCSPCSTIFD